MTRFKLLAELERDIRNQVVIDQMKHLTPRGKIMVQLRRYPIAAVALAASLLFILLCVSGVVRAEDFADRFPKATAYPCPDNQPCKILVLNAQEERILTGQNGVLDTAAQARSLDLGQFVVYLKGKIASAPAGTVTPPPEAKKDESKPQGNPALGAGPMNPADKEDKK
jgi:hypothetical protein